MHDITKYILEKRKIVLSGLFLCLVANLVLSKLWRGEFLRLLGRNYLGDIITCNIFWYIFHFPMRTWLYFVHNTRYKELFACELDFYVSPIVCVCCIIILAVSMPFVWFVKYPLDIINFPFIWFMFYAALDAEGDNLEDFFDE